MLLLVHAAATLTMFGVILVVQLVHYPLFQYVGAEGYDTYQAEHMRRISWIVGPAMMLELGTALWLVVDPGGVAAWQAWTGLGLVALIWGTTGWVHVPLHARLTNGFDTALHRRLVRTNWIRTGAWGLRAILVLAMLRTAAG
jgi:hypothetical protein